MTICLIFKTITVSHIRKSLVFIAGDGFGESAFKVDVYYGISIYYVVFETRMMLKFVPSTSNAAFSTICKIGCWTPFIQLFIYVPRMSTLSIDELCVKI